MTSANGETYARRYPCDGWVDDLVPKPSTENTLAGSISYRHIESANAERCDYGEISMRSSDATILDACASPLVSDTGVPEPCLITKDKLKTTGTRGQHVA